MQWFDVADYTLTVVLNTLLGNVDSKWSAGQWTINHIIDARPSKETQQPQVSSAGYEKPRTL